MKKLRSNITNLELHVKKAEADIRVRHDQKMSQIRGQYAHAMDKLRELEMDSRIAGRELRSDVDKAIDVLSEAVDTISQDIEIHPEE